MASRAGENRDIREEKCRENIRRRKSEEVCARRPSRRISTVTSGAAGTLGKRGHPAVVDRDLKRAPSPAAIFFSYEPDRPPFPSKCEASIGGRKKGKRQRERKKKKENRRSCAAGNWI